MEPENILKTVKKMDSMIASYAILSKDDFATSFEILKVCKHRRTGKLDQHY